MFDSFIDKMQSPNNKLATLTRRVGIIILSSLLLLSPPPRQSTTATSSALSIIVNIIFKINFWGLFFPDWRPLSSSTVTLSFVI